jgi:hypothetical protein
MNISWQQIPETGTYLGKVTEKHLKYRWRINESVGNWKREESVDSRGHC